jgi:hypothetical protein
MASMDLRSVLLEIHTALRDAEIAHALIGGLALAAHGAGRATTDLDLLADGERADDVDRILRERGYECLRRTQNVANYVAATAERGRIGFLFARRAHGRAMLERAEPHPVLGAEIPVADAADLIRLFDREKELDALLSGERGHEHARRGARGDAGGGALLGRPPRIPGLRCVTSSASRQWIGAPGAETISACSAQRFRRSRRASSASSGSLLGP